MNALWKSAECSRNILACTFGWESQQSSSGVVDVNERANLAGAEINIAQRVMDCGDAGHILLSKHVAEDLEEYERWRPLLHDLGSCEVKHGMRVSVVNLYDDEFGNAKLPRRFETVKKRRKRLRWAATTAALLALAAIVAGIVMFSRNRVRSTLAAPEKSIAVLPFENLSRDPDNAYFADGIQDEILTRLSKIADLKVISRTSTQHYKSAPENLPEIAQATWRRPHPGRKRAEERRRRTGECAANQSRQ